MTHHIQPGEPVPTSGDRHPLADILNTNLSPSAAATEALDKLFNNFTQIVGTTALQEVAVMKQGSDPVDLSAYRLLAITSEVKGFPAFSLLPLAYSYSLPDSVKRTYVAPEPNTTNEGRPHIDTRYGLGLLYGDWLVAVSAAGIDESGNVFMLQNQDVSSVSQKSPEERLLTGLDIGLRWPDTFIRSWEVVAKAVGVGKVVVQGAVNNRHAVVRAAKSHPSYDQAARRQGYKKLSDGNWQKQLGL